MLKNADIVPAENKLYIIIEYLYTGKIHFPDLCFWLRKQPNKS